MQIKAAVTHGKGEPFKIETVDLAAPQADEVLVRVVASGVCHTDEVAQMQIIPVPLPAVLGHEGSGIVEAVGASVQGLQPGDHVGFSFGSCGHCPSCLAAKPYACETFNDINFGGTMPDGTRRLSQNGQPVSSFFGQSSFATHAVVSQNGIVKIDGDIDLALVGPLGCGIQTGAGAVINRLQPEFGASIAVFGCGTVGMSAIMAAKIVGCAQIIAVGGNPETLELAKTLGATHTINRKTTADIPREIKALTKGGVNYAVDTTGSPESVKRALASVAFLGTLCVLGVTGDLTLNIHEDLMAESKSLVGCVEGDANPRVFIPQLLRYYQDGRFPFDKLIRFYDFEQINEAFADSHSGKTIKPVLKIGEI